MAEGLIGITRREFTRLSGLVLAAFATNQIGCARRLDDMETALFEDFLSEASIDKKELEELLYDVETRINTADGIKNQTRGRAVMIGDGYFLTAFHVVNPKEAKTEAVKVARDLSVKLEDISMKLIPQYRRGYLRDFAQEFELVSYDEKSDLALLKAPVEDRNGQARLHLAQSPLNADEGVSIFLRVLGRRRLIDYNFELKGRDYYNPAKELNLGRLSFPAGSLLFEKQGWVLPYRPQVIGKLIEDKDKALISDADANFSSILSYNGESGSPVFARLRNGSYLFVGMLNSACQI